MALLYLFPRRGLPTTGSELACSVPANFTTHTRTRSARLSLAPETWERGGERKWKEEKRKKEEKRNGIESPLNAGRLLLGEGTAAGEARRRRR